MNTEFKGTPGPWKAQLARSGSNRLQVSGPSGRQVCILWRHGPRETEANRNLLAAAPELLEALQDALCALECCGKDYPAATKARAAIARALGQED